MPRLPEEDNRKLMFIAANAAFSLMGSLETFNVSPRALAYNDITLPIGYDQRCSKPSLVAFMNDILDLHDGHTVLEIGAGCGYHAAVTRELIGASGRLTTVEIVPELAKKAAGNLKGYRNLDVVEGSGSSGYAKAAPYDRIYLTAGVKIYGFDERVFLDQMNTDDGAFLYPDPTAFNLARYEKGTLRRKRLQIGLSFVPLVDAR
ncbi:MAG: protein-L-isoaspartate O-methyltransferase [Candidatus Aenigmarchaeota archaeon]|nr:protein-L-isoaspartate O-methyltransferase [Candidatus Aenigmarchaeota archaeon]